jgi:hypothetical protein
VENLLDTFRHEEILDQGGCVDLVSQPKTETNPGTTTWAFFCLIIARNLARAFLMLAVLTILLPVFLDGNADSNQDVSGPFFHFGRSLVFN